MSFETILVGSGTLYVGPVGEAFPAVNANPAGNWVDMGEIDGGVTVTHDQTIDEHQIDSESGPVKATRSGETLVITANLAEATSANLAKVLDDQTVAASGTPNKNTTPLYRSDGVVAEHAFLFKGNSPSGAFNAQYQLPRGYFGGTTARSFTKDTKTFTPVEFHALVDDTAGTEQQKFGNWVEQTS